MFSLATPTKINSIRYMRSSLNKVALFLCKFPYREKILNKNEEVSSFVPPPLVEAPEEAPELDSRGGLQRKIS
jgi:hypothetical protein